MEVIFHLMICWATGFKVFEVLQAIWNLIFFVSEMAPQVSLLKRNKVFHDFFSFFQYCPQKNKLKNFKLTFATKWAQAMVGLNIFWGYLTKKIWLNNWLLTSTFCLGWLKIFKSVSHSLWSSFTINAKIFCSWIRLTHMDIRWT